MTNQKKTKWLNLSAYEARMAVLDVGEGESARRLLVLVDRNGNPENQDVAKIADALGFKKVQNDNGVFFIYPNGAKFNLSAFLNTLKGAGFDQAKISEEPVGSVFLKTSSPESKATAKSDEPKPQAEEENTGVPVSDAAPAQEEAKPAPVKKPKTAAIAEDELSVALKSSQLIGHNADGHPVRVYTQGEKENRRFYVNETTSRISEEAEDGNDPEMAAYFLRAADDAALKACADVFAKSIIKGEVQRFDDFQRFAGTIFGPHHSTDELTKLAAYIDNSFASWMRSSSRKTINELYSDGVKVAENSAYRSELVKRGLIGKAEGELNLPISIVLHRIAGSLSADGTKVVFSNPGTGAPFVKWKKEGTGRLEVYEDSEDSVQAIKDFSKEIGLRTVDVLENGPARFDDADVIVSNVRSGWLDKPFKRDGFTFARQEFADIIQALEARKNEGHGVFAFPIQAKSEEGNEFDQFMEYIGRNYAVEGACEIDSTVHSSISGGAKLGMMSIGQKRPEALLEAPEPSLRKREVFDAASLYTWSSEVIKARAKIRNFLSDDSLDEAKASDTERNEFQTPYLPASRLGQAETMVPKHLESEIRYSLARLQDAHPDVDEFVGNSIGYSKEELADRFAPEQIDAMALEAFGEEEGKRAFHIGDQTGVGKGRTAAGIAGRHLMNGKTVIMTTGRSANIADILRDLGDSGILPHVNPLIFNSGTYTYTDPKTGEEFSFDGLNKERALDELVQKVEVQATDENDDLMYDEDGAPVMVTSFRAVMPDEYNVIITTYSQISGKLEKLEQDEPGSMKTAKLRYFLEMVDDDCVMILDEAQKATGKGNTGKNIRHAIEKSNRTVFMSATHAKDVETMGLYNIMFPEYLSEEVVFEILKKGGESAQEVVASMLARNGVYIRREHDNSKLTFNTVFDDEHVERNQDIIDQLSPIMSEIAFLSGDVNRRIQAKINAISDNLEELEELVADMEQEDELAAMFRDENLEEAAPNEELAQHRAEARRNRKKIRNLRSSKMSLGSPLFRIMKSVIAAMKADAIAKNAIQNVKDGKKPVIMVDGTLGALYQEIFEAQQNEEIDFADAPDVKDLVRREVRLLFSGVISNFENIDDFPDEEKDQIREDYGRFLALTRMADDIPDLPISLIDSIKNKTKEAGFVFEEITGRALEYNGNKIVRRNRPSTTEIVDNFNNGDTDGLIINKSGLEGLSMQDAEWFKNHGQRIMHEGDSPLDINDQIQGYGRINRRGSLTDPEIWSYNSGIPYEMRAHAARNAKLRKLSANVSSNRDNSALIEGIPDMLNRVGDKVCTRYFDSRPDLLRLIGLEEDFAEAREKENENGGDTSEIVFAANMILGRMALLPCAIQDEVLNDLQTEYEATIEELDSMMMNPLKPKQLPGLTYVQSKMVLEGPNSDEVVDAFESPVYLEEAIVKHQKKPITGDELEDLVSEGAADPTARHRLANYDVIDVDREDRLHNMLRRPSISSRFLSVDAAIQQGDNALANESRRMDHIQKLLTDVIPGSEIKIQDFSGETKTGVVTKVVYPNPGTRSISAESYKVQIMTPGSVQPTIYTFGGLLADLGFTNKETGEFNIKKGLNDPDDKNVEALLSMFDNASLMEFYERVHLLTGNIFRAMQISEENKNIGSMCVYYDANEGIDKRGVVLRSKNLADAEMLLNKIAVPVRSPEMVFDAMRENVGLTLQPDSERKKKALTLKSLTNGYEITMPHPNNKDFGWIYNDNDELYAEYLAIRDEMGENAGRRQVKKVVREPDELLRFVRAVMRDGKVSFWAGPSYRDWANEWAQRKNEQALNGRSQQPAFNAA